MKLLILGLVCLLQCALSRRCDSNADCGSDECCSAKGVFGFGPKRCTPLSTRGESCSLSSDQERPLACPCAAGLTCRGRLQPRGRPTFISRLSPTGKCEVERRECNDNQDCEDGECCAVAGFGLNPKKECAPLGKMNEACAISYNPERPLQCPCAAGLECRRRPQWGESATFIARINPTGKCGKPERECQDDQDCDAGECCVVAEGGVRPKKTCAPLAEWGDECAVSQNPERPLACPCAAGLFCRQRRFGMETFIAQVNPTGRCRYDRDPSN